MANINAPLIGFEGGLIGDLLHGRVDIKSYPKGADVMRNFWPGVHGPMTRRPPLEYVGTVEGLTDPFGNSIDPAYMLPFTFSTEQSYNIVATASGATIWTQAGKVTTPLVASVVLDGAFSSNTPDYASASTRTASSTASGSLANLVDGNPSTYWQSGAGATEWVTFQLPLPLTLTHVCLTATTAANEMPTSWSVQMSANGAFAGEQVTVLTVTGDAPWNAGERRCYRIAAPTAGLYARIVMTATGGAVATATFGDSSGEGGGSSGYGPEWGGGL